MALEQPWQEEEVLVDENEAACLTTDGEVGRQAVSEWTADAKD